MQRGLSANFAQTAKEFTLPSFDFQMPNNRSQKHTNPTCLSSSSEDRTFSLVSPPDQKTKRTALDTGRAGIELGTPGCAELYTVTVGVRTARPLRLLRLRLWHHAHTRGATIHLISFRLISFCLSIFTANRFVSFHLRERKRERERETDRQTETETER